MCILKLKPRTFNPKVSSILICNNFKSDTQENGQVVYYKILDYLAVLSFRKENLGHLDGTVG